MIKISISSGQGGPTYDENWKASASNRQFLEHLKLWLKGYCKVPRDYNLVFVMLTCWLMKSKLRALNQGVFLCQYWIRPFVHLAKTTCVSPISCDAGLMSMKELLFYVQTQPYVIRYDLPRLHQDITKIWHVLLQYFRVLLEHVHPLNIGSLQDMSCAILCSLFWNTHKELSTNSKTSSTQSELQIPVIYQGFAQRLQLCFLSPKAISSHDLRKQ